MINRRKKLDAEVVARLKAERARLKALGADPVPGLLEAVLIDLAVKHPAKPYSPTRAKKNIK